MTWIRRRPFTEIGRALPCLTHAPACGIWFDAVSKCDCWKPQLVQEIQSALRHTPKDG